MDLFAAAVETVRKQGAPLADRMRPRSVSAMARSSNIAMSCAPKCRRTNTRQRDSSALFSSNYGFSVVAPSSASVPSSTAGKKPSC